jgi:hypothetical protein
MASAITAHRLGPTKSGSRGVLYLFRIRYHWQHNDRLHGCFRVWASNPREAVEVFWTTFASLMPPGGFPSWTAQATA